jgi:hypothetical protein
MRTTVLFLLLAAGCGANSEPRPSTGGRETAAAFFEAIARQDWDAAYDKIDAEARKKMTRADFVTRAKSYRKGLGFELEKVHVRLCEEQGDKANAHLTLSTANDSLKNSFREAVPLRREQDTWGVVLPANFGAKR